VADRLDVLGLDRGGRLVVVELQRDRAPDTVTMQAINYAATAIHVRRSTDEKHQPFSLEALPG
jgi:RecB family endonuclease NucS